MEFPALDLRPVTPEQHRADYPIARDEIEELLRDEGFADVEPVYYVHDDGTKQLVGFGLDGSGELIAESLDLELSEEGSPRIAAIVEAAVMGRVEALVAEGFRLGVEFARSGRVNGINLIEELRQSA